MIRDFLRRPAILILLLLGAGVIVYSNALEGEFILDDSTSIIANPNIQHLWPLTRAASAPPRTTITALPTICLSMAVNFAISRLNVSGWRAVNLLIHLLTTLALFGIVRRTLADSPSVSGWLREEAAPLAFFSAFVFELHPLQTNIVNYVVQRTESIMVMFYLTTIYCAVRALQSTIRRDGMIWSAASIIACAAGMGSKETMVSAPLALLLYDRTFQAGSFKAALFRSFKMYAGLTATWSVLACLLLFGNRREGSQWGQLPYSGFQYCLAQGNVILYYLRLTLLPSSLCFDYGWPVASYSAIGTLLVGDIGVLLLLGATVWALVKRPALGFIGAMVFMTLAPTSSIIPLPDACVEYRMYLPLAALSTLLVVSAWWVLGKIRLRTGLRIVILIAWGGLLGIVSFNRNVDYHSAVAVWRDVTRKRPDHARGHANFGVALAEEAKRDAAAGRPGDARQKLELAVAEFNQAQRLKPELEDVHLNLASALALLGRSNEALFHFQAAAAADPNNPSVFYSLGNLLSDAGNNDAAADAYLTALRLNPDFRDAHYNFGIDLFNRGKLAEALTQFNETIRVDPLHADAHCMAGIVLAKNGQRDAAAIQFRAALEIRPDFPKAKAALKQLAP